MTGGDGVRTQVPVGATAPGATMGIPLPPALAVGDFIEVRQTKGSLTSPYDTNSVGASFALPAPVFEYSPLLACAQSLMLEAHPGATLDIVRQRPDADGTLSVFATYQRVANGSLAWVDLTGEPPLVEGEVLTVQQSLCEPGGTSTPETVSAAPTVLPVQTLVPSSIMAGQPLIVTKGHVQGASFVVREGTTSPFLDVASVPVGNLDGQDAFVMDLAGPLGGPPAPSQTFMLQQQLCEASRSSAPIPVEACDPGELWAPIHQPVEGVSFVAVTDSVPGATIHVWAGSEHLAAGPVTLGRVDLSRALQGGEIVSVTQELIGCMGSRAFQISVVNQ